MGGSDGKNVEKQPVAVGLSKEAYKNVLSFVPSTEASKKYEQLRFNLAKYRENEKAQRSKENPDKWLNEALGGMDAKGKMVKDVASGEIIEDMDDEVSSEDVEAIMSVLKSGSESEKKDVLRFHLLHNFLTRKGFKKNQKEWKGEYKEKKSKNPDLKISEKDYVYERGMEKIRVNRDLVISGRVSDWLDNAGLKEEHEKKEDECKKGINEDVFTFLNENESQLIDEKTDKKVLRKQFVQIFLDHGCAEEDIKGLEGLFDEILGDIEYAAVMQQAYSDSYEKMIAMSGKEMTDEEWDQQVKKELEEKAKGNMKEAVEELAKQMWGAPTGVSKSPEVSYSSISEIANSNAVSIRSEGGDMYSIEFPSLGKNYSPKMKIVLPKGSNDLNLATYIIEDKFADENVPNSSDQIGKGKRSLAYSAVDLPKVLARIQLDYELHKAVISIGDSNVTSAEVNKILSDDRLIKMSERLFNFNLNEHPILPQHMRKYENLLSIILKPDGNKSFVERTLDMEFALNNDGMLPYIRKNLNRATSSKIFSVSELLKKVELDRAGKKKNKDKKEE